MRSRHACAVADSDSPETMIVETKRKSIAAEEAAAAAPAIAECMIVSFLLHFHSIWISFSF